MSSKKNIILSGAAALVVAVSILAVSIFSGFSLLPTTSSGAPKGTLSVLLTDPPHVPFGVTKVYITYSNLAVHVSEAGNQSGWTLLKSGGSIELLSTVNVGQTISSVKIGRRVQPPQVQHFIGPGHIQRKELHRVRPHKRTDSANCRWHRGQRLQTERDHRQHTTHSLQHRKCVQPGVHDPAVGESLPCSVQPGNTRGRARGH